jgi:K+-sensing histidine kinase KdpD
MRRGLDNTLKYTESPEWIDVSLSARGDRATITIRDSGLGISPDDQPLIFDHFTAPTACAARSKALAPVWQPQSGSPKPITASLLD